MPEFAAPQWLWLLLLLPLVPLLRWRGGADEGRTRRMIGSLLRMLSLAMLVVALAAPLSADDAARGTDVIFALDASRSIGPEQLGEALAFINQAGTRAPSGSRVGLVVFGADAEVERLPQAAAEPIRELGAQVQGEATDVARGLEVALGAFQAARNRRVVLLSDGQENQGDARAAAAVARAMGVEISTVALRRDPARDEVRIRGFSAPARVSAHEPFELRLQVHARRPVEAELVVLRNGALLENRTVQLRAGDNSIAFVEQAEDSGLVEYEAIVNPVRDGEPGNNSYQAFVEVSGVPRVLHAVGGEGEGAPLREALAAQGLTVTTVPGSALPGSMRELADHDLVILDDVSGFDLSLAKMELLQDYVSNAGGGLIMLGGARSFAAGGYHATPVEEVLPVAMDVSTEVKIPSLAVAFVLDRSGSMGSRSHGEEKLSIAKSAALAAIEVLNPMDRVGVLAFDSAAEWVVPLTLAQEREAIVERLRTLSTGGGTDLFAALQEAHREMLRQQAKVKHLIVLSDGLNASSGSFDALGEAVARDGITISTVAMGADSDRQLMQRLATRGRGRYYYTDDIRNVPRIFTSETLVVARELMVERRVQPRLVRRGELLQGLAAEALPALDGYQRVFAKPGAQVLLDTGSEDPLLVTWRHGLGKALVFTSDLRGRWSGEWLRWPGFNRLAGQMARWTLRRSGKQVLLPRFSVSGQRAEVLVDALDPDQRFINGLTLRGVVSDAQRNASEVGFEQIAPGRYRASFPVSGSGRYYLTLSAPEDPDAGLDPVGPRTFGLAVPYSDEYLDLGVNTALLEDLASATGGRALDMRPAAIAGLVAPREAASPASQRLVWPLVLIALLALVAEVAVRKLPVPARWRGAGAAGTAGDGAGDAAEQGALARRIARRRARQLEALDAGRGGDDPVSRARLYLARRGRRTVGSR
jgi:Mg-chelatase subunit ChlD